MPLIACGTLSPVAPETDMQQEVQLPTPPISQRMTTGTRASAPYGFVDFCKRHSEDCQRQAAAAASPVALTRARWAEPQAINWEVNTAITPVTDAEHYQMREYWTYPTAEQGDCEDYALAKRQRLIAAGWPEQNLLLSVALEEAGTAHAVLIVTTDKGDYVLDNQSYDILPWRETPYRWAKRQSQHHPQVWVSLDAASPRTATASSR